VALIPFTPDDRAALAKAIRSDSRLQQTKFIAALDRDDRTEAGAVRQAGFSGELHCPFTQSQLLDAITTITVRRPPPKPAPAPQKPAGYASLHGLHLLVAEDNEMNQFVTQETLRRAGCTCDIVADGTLALGAFRRRYYDAILMDCQMPTMDGLEASRRIREQEQSHALRRIPIIALTAEAIDGDREKCLAAGMDGYVSKPINAADLFAAIQSLVRKEVPVDAPAGPATNPSEPSAPASAAAPIDIKALLARCLDDSTFASETLDQFSQRAVEDVERLRLCVSQGQSENAQRLAHNLKAVASYVAAGQLRNIAFEIEKAGAQRDLQFIEEHLTALDNEAKRCAAYVPEAMAQLASHAGAKSLAKQTR
jgi:CheY-like chemotaxis protein/HPt (histidine-containing phosphotransfer) domain-containing protein